MDLLNQFRQYLKDQEVSVNTRKNYVSDLSTFVDFLKIQNQYFSILTLPFILDAKTLNNYRSWLEKKDPVSTANRRLSSLRKFISFAIETNSISRDYTGSVSNFAILSSTKGIQTLESYDKFLATNLNDSDTIKEYSSDIKDYLVSTSTTSDSVLPLEQRPFSLKQFWHWKNTSADSTTVSSNNIISFRESQSLSWAYFLVGLGGLCILLAIGIGIIINNRPGGFGDLGFLQSLTKKTISTSLPNGASGLVDPTRPIGRNGSISPSIWIERTWSIFWTWLSAPDIIDPTSTIQ